jgi:hypothetical protein
LRYAARMAGKRNNERDDCVKLPLDPETALRALLAVDPDDEPAEDDQDEKRDPEQESGPA